jgi:hypothetical protein
MGPGDQFVPAQASVSGLKITVPSIAEGQDPWKITPAGVELQNRISRGPKGLDVTIDEFDTVCPIVFTDDIKMVAWWQDSARRYGRHAARWALDQTAEEYEKVRIVHLKLAEHGQTVRGADRLFEETQRLYIESQKHFANEQYEKSYRDAVRALRPLRLIMRDHWQQAVQGLDVPTASPFAVSYFSLPQHYELAKEVQGCRPGPTQLPYGNFELGSPLPGWSARTGSLASDRVQVAAGIVPAEGLDDEKKPRTHLKEPKSLFNSSRPVAAPDEGYTDPAPELGKTVLKLEVRRNPPLDPSGKPIPMNPALERTFLAVDSPVVKLPPGTLVRVSAWIKVNDPIVGDAAGGALFYDDAGGEPLSVRVLKTGTWKQYHLYRRVPVTGQIAVTLAMTGQGIAYFDDIRIEPLEIEAGSSKPSSPTGPRIPVVPAGYKKP